MNGYGYNELKSFNLDAQGSLVKFSFQKPHDNNHNTKSQVCSPTFLISSFLLF